MSANQSNLSSAQYGYDFVVATTQDSINDTMKEFLSNLTEPEVTICYIADGNGNPTPISYADLLKKTNGTDPFTIPNDADPSPSKNPEIKNLFDAEFMIGIRAQVGVPLEMDPSNIPDIVTLGADTSEVSYNLMCSEFTVVQFVPPGGYSPASWMNVSQPGDAPWLFNSKVDLRLSDTDQSAYSKLPPAVQAQIKDLDANAFSIQQLLFDLDNAALESIPTISGAEPGTNLYAVLQKDFVGKYFSTMKQNGEPMLGVTVTHNAVDPATFTLTDLNMEVSPFLDANGKPVAHSTTDQQGLATLNYLCAVNKHTLPAAVNFQWNWVDPTQESDFDGVIAINRNTFAKYFEDKLTPYVKKSCFKAEVDVSTKDVLEAEYWWKLTAGQTPNVSITPTGSTVLSYSYESYANDSAGAGADIGQMTLYPQFNVDVAFTGNTIVITQHLLIYLRVQTYQNSKDGNIVDKTIVDTYTLFIDDTGKLNCSAPSSQATDNSETPSVNGFLNFFTGLNSLLDDIEQWTSNFIATRFSDIPVSVAQNFIFPGGKTFAFKDVVFSDNQDLIGHITYLDPS